MKSIDLNIEQRKAVESTEGPLLIIAGAGSGKTRVLVERTLNLLVNKKVAPEKILISTFTDRASKELIGRITKRLDEHNEKINIGNIYIGTLHSIFLRLIDEYIEFSNFKEGYRVLEDMDQDFFIYSKLKYFKELQGYNEFFTGDNFCRNAWERAKKLKYWLNKINETGRTLDYIKDDSNERVVFLRDAHKLYENLLIEDNVLDFASIQREIYRMLSTKEEVLREVQEKIEYIMIDEYQDTNIIQEKIIFLIGEKRKNICVVGDDDQGIYRFRGATVRNIIEFPSRFTDVQCETIILNKNYRSHRDIITFCNRWINLINWRGFRYEKNIEPLEEREYSDRAGVVRIGGNSDRAWKENIYKFIKTLKTTGKIEDYSQVAFLFKSTRSSRVKDLGSYLEERGIPVYSPRSKTFFYKKEIKLVMGALLAVFPQTKAYVLDNVFLGRTIAYYKDCLGTLKKERTVLEDVELYNWLLEKRKEYLNFGEEKRDNFSEIFYSLFAFKTFKNLINLEVEGAKDASATYNLGLFSKLLKQFEFISKLEKFTMENIERTLKYFFIIHMKLLFEEELDEYENKGETPKGAVSFMTIHQAKGLEFPVVIVGSLENDPLIRDKADEEMLEKLTGIYNEFEPEDQRERFDFWRVFYTAFSRAKNLLVLTSIENRSGGKEIPARTFRPIYETIPYFTDENFKDLDIDKHNGAELKESFSYTRDILLYDECPLKYRFLREYEFATLKTNEISYGLLVHQSIEAINKQGIKDSETVFDDEIVRDIIEKSSNGLYNSIRALIRKQDKDRAFTVLKKYIEYIGDNWKNILSSEEKIYSVEDNYLLEGIVDLILKRDGKIQLIDFKTGKFQGYESENFHIHKRQLEIYGYILKKKYLNEDIELYIYYVGDGESSIIKVEADEKSLDIGKAEFDNIVKKILDKRFERRVFSEKSCKKCEFVAYCRGEK